ncbi:MAG: peptidylprolyl isomerase [Deltaproteobacteria bacterium]|nr:peptidylprolyl isomerase [Deltaproteobacteria bacterium]
MRLILPLMLLVACVQPPAATVTVPGAYTFGGDAVATVNGTAIHQGMVDAVTRRIPADRLEMMKAHGQLDDLVDNLVTGELLYDEAIKLELYKTPEVQEALAMSAREVLASALIDKVTKDGVNDEALQKMYEERAVQFQKPMVHARHILVADEAQANDLIAQIKGGGSFEALATANSTDKGSAAKGGDLGWFEKARMVPSFAEAAFAANKGDVVGPVQSQYGYHIIEVLDKREVTPLEEVRPTLEKGLQQKVVEDYIEQIKASATISMANAKPAAPTDVLDELTPPAPPAAH